MKCIGAVEAAEEDFSVLADNELQQAEPRTPGVFVALQNSESNGTGREHAVL